MLDDCWVSRAFHVWRRRLRRRSLPEPRLPEGTRECARPIFGRECLSTDNRATTRGARRSAGRRSTTRFPSAKTLRDLSTRTRWSASGTWPRAGGSGEGGAGKLRRRLGGTDREPDGQEDGGIDAEAVGCRSASWAVVPAPGWWWNLVAGSRHDGRSAGAGGRFCWLIGLGRSVAVMRGSLRGGGGVGVGVPGGEA